MECEALRPSELESGILKAFSAGSSPAASEKVILALPFSSVQVGQPTSCPFHLGQDLLRGCRYMLPNADLYAGTGLPVFFQGPINASAST